MCVALTWANLMASLGGNICANWGCDPHTVNKQPTSKLKKINIKQMKQYKANQASRGDVKLN